MAKLPGGPVRRPSVSAEVLARVARERAPGAHIGPATAAPVLVAALLEAAKAMGVVTPA